MSKAIYIPTPVVDIDKHDGIKFFRVIGWRKLQNKDYWIFSYTLTNEWGLNNYALIPMRDYNLNFIHLSLN